MKKINFVLNMFFLSLVLLSCQKENLINDDIKAVDIQLDILRFDSIFYNSTPNDLSDLKSTYPFMFNPSIPDSILIMKMEDTLQNEIGKEVALKFDDFQKTENDLILFFKHIKYYYPNIDLPKVITLAEYVDYKSKVIVNDDLLFISLDNYLGKDHRFYSGFKDYIASLQDPNQILPDISEAYSKKIVKYPVSRNFLSQLIYQGKLLYFKEKTLPLVPKHHLIGYTEDELLWAENEEKMIWQFFIQKELLYSSDMDLKRRFIENGPFTKFYLEIDNETPPRLGQYIGWKIVKAFANKHPNLELDQVLEKDYQEIFESSKYKP